MYLQARPLTLPYDGFYGLMSVWDVGKGARGAVMDPQPMGTVRDLSRLAGRVAARSTVRWSSLWKFLGICLLAAVVGGPAVGLPHAQGAAAVAGMPQPAQAQGPALSPQRITFDQPQDTAVGLPVRLSA